LGRCCCYVSAFPAEPEFLEDYQPGERLPAGCPQIIISLGMTIVFLTADRPFVGQRGYHEQCGFGLFSDPNGNAVVVCHPRGHLRGRLFGFVTGQLIALVKLPSA
jgi:hypothetical protein